MLNLVPYSKKISLIVLLSKGNDVRIFVNSFQEMIILNMGNLSLKLEDLEPRKGR